MEVDAKLMGRPPPIDGNGAAGAYWVFQTRAHLEVMDTAISDALDFTDVATGEIPLQRCSADNKVAALQSLALAGTAPAGMAPPTAETAEAQDV